MWGPVMVRRFFPLAFKVWRLLFRFGSLLVYSRPFGPHNLSRVFTSLEHLRPTACSHHVYSAAHALMDDCPGLRALRTFHARLPCFLSAHRREAVGHRPPVFPDHHDEDGPHQAHRAHGVSEKVSVSIEFEWVQLIRHIRLYTHARTHVCFFFPLIPFFFLKLWWGLLSPASLEWEVI